MWPVMMATIPPINGSMTQLKIPEIKLTIAMVLV
jgi:hypothetical protein